MAVVVVDAVLPDVLIAVQHALVAAGAHVLPRVTVEVPASWGDDSALAVTAWVHGWARAAEAAPRGSVLLDSPVACAEHHTQHAAWLVPLCAAVLGQVGATVIVVGGGGSAVVDGLRDAEMVDACDSPDAVVEKWRRKKEGTRP